MRVSELCNLDVKDLNLENNEILVKDTKNYNDRKVILSEKCVRVLQEYLGTVQDYEGDAVFISRKSRRISRNRVYSLVRKYGRLAGIKRKVTPPCFAAYFGYHVDWEWGFCDRGETTIGT